LQLNSSSNYRELKDPRSSRYYQYRGNKNTRK